jgi:hypothetical protein
MPALRACRVVLVLAGALFAACSQDYPSRDWSGSYLTRMVAASSDCHEAPVPPAMPEFIAELEQEGDNRATLWVNPVVQLAGSFEGDVLAATAARVDSVGLPDTLARQIQPADSFETVTHDFRGEFEDWRFRGEYVIRSPDILALVRGVRPLRCTLRYELEGTRFEPPAISEQPWLQELEADTSAPAVPADTAVRGDTSASTNLQPKDLRPEGEGPAGSR